MAEERLIDANALLEKLRTEREEIYPTSQYNVGYLNGMTFAQSVALAAPTVEPERPKGQWEKRGYKWQCTHCKVLMDIDGTPQENLLNFCPNCGADMRGESE